MNKDSLKKYPLRENNKRGFTPHLSVRKGAGFTLIELLIVVAVIAILAGAVFVALDPLSRFQNTRDARRASDVDEMISAVKVDQIDNGGAYLSAITSMTAGDVYIIGTDSTACDSYNGNCDTSVTGSTYCVDLSGLVTEGYLGVIPVSPDGAGTWTAGHTGYTLSRDASGIITARACESENTTEISVSR